jgi:hypothetical protein
MAARFVEYELADLPAAAETAGALGLLEHDDAVAVGGQQPGESRTRDAAAENRDLQRTSWSGNERGSL